MNPTDIHGMALALGLPSALAQIEAVKLLVAEAVASEREACARICEQFADQDSGPDGIFIDYHAHLIRARGAA